MLHKTRQPRVSARDPSRVPTLTQNNDKAAPQLPRGNAACQASQVQDRVAHAVHLPATTGWNIVLSFDE